TKIFLPHLKTRPEAHIVNISSVFGIIAVPTQSAYNASKFAVKGFTECLKQELADTSVGVTCVHPGGIKTNIVRNGRMYTDQFGEASDAGKMAAEFEKMARTTPEQAAKDIYDAILGKEERVLIGADARVIDLMQRLFPTRYPKIIRFILEKTEALTK
ncbi:MAG TPA: SDR family NAD(P)-dependent oxidoreductase, partial [Pseudomonadales bacterium]|nr:SDR family NAD(P)-dependent oxidoreductase [Pseudomonadales bacterium]